MNVCSYLVHVRPGTAEAVTGTLNALPGCDAVPAENRDLVILVTETPDKQTDKDLTEQIQSLNDIECLALTFGAQETLQPKEVSS